MRAVRPRRAKAASQRSSRSGAEPRRRRSSRCSSRCSGAPRTRSPRPRQSDRRRLPGRDQGPPARRAGARRDRHRHAHDRCLRARARDARALASSSSPRISTPGSTSSRPCSSSLVGVAVFRQRDPRGARRRAATITTTAITIHARHAITTMTGMTDEEHAQRPPAAGGKRRAGARRRRRLGWADSVPHRARRPPRRHLAPSRGIRARADRRVQRGAGRGRLGHRTRGDRRPSDLQPDELRGAARAGAPDRERARRSSSSVSR